MTDISFPASEKLLSQLPALQLLAALGWHIVTPVQANAERRNRLSSVLLEETLAKQLSEINRIRFQGETYEFSEANIQEAVQKLKSYKYDGLLHTNQELTDLLIMGTSEAQTINGFSKSFTLNYIDWQNPERNVFQAVPEFSVERTRSSQTVRPDIVLFVNGIPLGVIECKAPSLPVGQGVTQHIRNQTDDYIPQLFVFTQILFAVNKNEATYATAGTPEKFWSVWKELAPDTPAEKKWEASFLRAVHTDFSPADAQAACTALGLRTAEIPSCAARLPTAQDRTLFSLCFQPRFLELIRGYILFDNGEKKIARYQQYFVTKSTLDRVQHTGSDGIRQGGIIWHTQGSGKSLTMVMIAKNLVFCTGLPSPRIVLVTDREDLDIQLGDTFKHCGLTPVRATSGRNLLDLVSEKKASVITTLVHKFDNAAGVRNFHDDSADIFVLVDESHRTQFGSFAAKMRQLFPRACYIGFTGTPLMKKEKNSFAKFGGLIRPAYTISQAVEDKAVLPLLYEGRLVNLTQNKEAIDLWFERHTEDLTDKQKADLKKKYARADMLQKTDQVIYMRAFDINEHYKTNWQGTGFKAQLVAPDKESAVKYKQFFDELGEVTADVLISSPDTREAYTDILDEPSDIVNAFWKKMMAKYSDEKKYNRILIDSFKNGGSPEIIIVVDKLLTGFDAPVDTVLYLCRPLKAHTLLQAIARVNRLAEGKPYGYIVDYADVLEDLSSALTSYEALAGFDEADLAGAVTGIRKITEQLPQQYSDLLSVFKIIADKNDEEAYEQLLADEKLRDEFYRRLREYAKTLSIALSSEQFLMQTEPADMTRYRTALRRFEKLRTSVQFRYAEAVDYRDYEPKIKKLLNTHIHADTVTQLNKPAYIINDEGRSMLVAEEEPPFGVSTAAQADHIAFMAKQTINENMDEDPAFYEKFSVLIQQVIDDFRQKRISDIEYLSKVKETVRRLTAHEHDDIPADIQHNDNAIACYGVINPVFTGLGLPAEQVREISSGCALAFDELFDKNVKVNFWSDENSINAVKNAMDDYFYDVIKKERGIAIPSPDMDVIINKVFAVQKKRRTC